MMKSLIDYINEALLLEFKQDLIPQTVIVMGGSGVCK